MRPIENRDKLPSGVFFHVHCMKRPYIYGLHAGETGNDIVRLITLCTKAGLLCVVLDPRVAYACDARTREVPQLELAAAARDKQD